MQNISKQSPSFVKRSVLLLFVAIISYSIKFIFNVFLARHLSKGLYGDFTVALKTFMLMSTILLLGTDTASKNFLSLYIKEHNDSGVREYISWNFRLVVMVSSVFLLALLFLLTSLVFLHLYGIRSIENYHMAIHLLFFSPIGAIAVLIVSYLQCNNNIYLANFLQNASRFIFIIGLLFLGMHFFGFVMSEKTLSVTVAVAFVFLAITEIVIIFIKLPNIPVRKVFQKRSIGYEKQSGKKWRSTALKLTIGQLLFSLVMTIDIYLVEIFAHTEVAVDKYAAVLVVASFVWVVTKGVYSFMIPLIRYYFEYNQRLLQRAINSAVICNFVAILVMLPLLITLLKPILHMFGYSYFGADTFWCFVILASSFSFGSFARAAIALISYSGGSESLLIYVSVVEICILIIAGSILTFYFGIIGTAIASALSVSVETIFFVLLSRFKLKLRSVIII